MNFMKSPVLAFAAENSETFIENDESASLQDLYFI